MMAFRVAGINFDHMYMGDLLRQVHDHPQAAIVGVRDADPARMAAAIAAFSLSPGQIFTEVCACPATRPNTVILCPASADHASFVEQVAGHALTILQGKPFAASLAEADGMIAACAAHGTRLAIDWPLASYPSRITTKRMIDDGSIGTVQEVHFVDGHRGPLHHLADKIEVCREEVERKRPGAWWYKAASGGGSLLDYLGYGTTLGTWLLTGEAPLEVTAVTSGAPGLEVDEHAICVLRYARGLSRMETRWGSFTDPRTLQPQPKCGSVVVGTERTISSWDDEDHVTVQTRARPQATEVPNDPVDAPFRATVEYLLHCLETGQPVRGPLDPAIARTGQRNVDTAFASARAGRTLALVG